MSEDQRKSFSVATRQTSENMNSNRTALYSQLSNPATTRHQHEGLMYHRNSMLAPNHSMDVLAENMNRMNLPTSYNTSEKYHRSISGQSFDNGVALNTNIPQAFVYNGQLMLAGSHIHPGISPSGTSIPHGPAYHSAGAQYLSQPNFQYGHMMNGYSPLSTAWAGSRVPSGDIPSLVTPRRDSSSSHENEPPGTPFNHFANYGDCVGGVNGVAGGVAVVDRSPHSMYAAWSTPSPPQNGYKQPCQPCLSPRLTLLVQQSPRIPQAVPAPYSPVKPLDRSLENIHGVTNVYVRGLLPDTTDEMLKLLAGRFGEIVSSKSIIDHSTGKCKGFGFVKYHNFKDAEDCIRGFHSLGYETSFARESFYSQLKKLADDGNTNLYVSNLPKDMNEHELSTLFGGHKVCSSRILRDSAGNGRGVGFARFESREVCEEVIKNFDKTLVDGNDGQEYTVQIRFADTQDQKALKQQTAAARQYRTAEYESQTAGRPTWGVNQSNGTSEASRIVENNDFETYMTKYAGKLTGPQSRGGLRDRLNGSASHLAPIRDTPVNGISSNGSLALPETRVATVEGTTNFENQAETHAGPSNTDNDIDEDLIDLETTPRADCSDLIDLASVNNSEVASEDELVGMFANLRLYDCCDRD